MWIWQFAVVNLIVSAGQYKQLKFAMGICKVWGFVPCLLASPIGYGSKKLVVTSWILPQTIWTLLMWPVIRCVVFYISSTSINTFGFEIVISELCCCKTCIYLQHLFMNFNIPWLMHLVVPVFLVDCHRFVNMQSLVTT